MITLIINHKRRLVITFTEGTTYEWHFVIDGRPVPISAVFTGRIFEINGVEFGRFENVTTKKPYLLTKEGFEKLQLVENEALADGEVW